MAWLSDWAKRIQLTIDDTNVDGNLSDFPVLVYISAASGIGDVDASPVFDELTSDANRKKIAVTSSDGTTQLYVEIEKWDDAGEKAWLWVKVPSILASGGETIYLYYDATKADNTTYVGDIGSAPGQTVWDSNFVFVCHMAQDPSGGAGAVKDSTSNGNNGTSGGTMLTEDLVSSLDGMGIQFDGSDDYIDFDSPVVLDDISLLTLECNLYLDGWGTDSLGRPLSKIAQNVNGWFLATRSSNTALQFSLDRATAMGAWRSAVGSIALSTQYVIGITYDNTSTANDPIFYINGQTSATTELVSPSGAVDSDASSEFWIGATENSGTPYREFAGIVDEVRISNIIRGADWLKATYYSNNDNIITFGSEATYSEDMLVTLTEAFTVTCSISATLAIGIPVTEPLSVQISISAETGFVVFSNPFNIDISMSIGSIVMIGRELLARDSRITKILTGNSPITKLLERDSLISDIDENSIIGT